MRPKMRRGVFNWISRGSTRGTALTAAERSIGLDNFGADRTERILTRLAKKFEKNFLAKEKDIKMKRKKYGEKKKER